MTAAGSTRHPTARAWAVPPRDRPGRPGLAGLERVNLREIASREGRFEHHLMVCATLAGARLEIATASEPLYFAHINVSDEYALALPTGDDLVDAFPLRTFLTDPVTGEDVGRYNHRVGDIVLHPRGLLHWPGRLRPPYEPFAFPPGMRRAGLSLLYCAGEPTPSSWLPLPIPPGREGDVKASREPAPPMLLASLKGGPGVLGRIGPTSLSLVESPTAIEPPNGAWVVVLEAEPDAAFAPCDLVRVPPGGRIDGKGITRALLLAGEGAPPDAAPALWAALPAPPFAPFEDAPPGELPFDDHGLRAEEASATTALVTVGGARAEIPRYWLARMLYRAALHDLRLAYVETYEGLFLDDRRGLLEIGLRQAAGRASVEIPRAEAMAFVEGLYRAIAPKDYRERIT